MKRFPIGFIYFISLSGLLLGPLVIVLAGGPRPVVVTLMTLSFFITSLGLGIANVVVVTLRQILTPQSMMSRMTACFRMLLYGDGARIRPERLPAGGSVRIEAPAGAPGAGGGPALS